VPRKSPVPATKMVKNFSLLILPPTVVSMRRGVFFLLSGMEKAGEETWGRQYTEAIVSPGLGYVCP